MKRYILSIIALVLFATTLYAQEQTAAATNDSVPALTKKELRKQKVARRNLHYNILGGPSYTPDFGAVLGGSALMTFRINPSDTTQLRSVVPMAIASCSTVASIFSPSLNSSSRVTVSVSSESLAIKYGRKLLRHRL